MNSDTTTKYQIPLNSSRGAATASNTKSNDAANQTPEQMLRNDLNDSVLRLGRYHRSSIKCTEDLAWCLQSNGDWLQAESCYNDCLEAREMIHGYESMEAIRIVGALASVCRSQGKLEEAKRFSQRALDVRSKVQGVEHISTLKTAHNFVCNNSSRFFVNQLHKTFLRLAARRVQKNTRARQINLNSFRR